MRTARQGGDFGTTLRKLWHDYEMMQHLEAGIGHILAYEMEAALACGSSGMGVYCLGCFSILHRTSRL